MQYSSKYTEVANSGLVTYNPLTGKFYSKKGDEKRMIVDHRGYLRLAVGSYKSLIAHRVAWAIYYGELPCTHIDHIDGDKKNNKIENLRICTHNQNQHNQGIRSNNTSGYKGVSFSKHLMKWQAQICCNKKVTSLGFFNLKEDAAHAYDKAAIEAHGEFAWTNFPPHIYMQE